MPSGRVALTIAAFVCAAVPCPAQIPVGESFRVNSGATGDQVVPAVAVDRSSGRFVVVWADRTPFVAASDIVGQHFAADGSPAGAEFRVSSLATNFRSIRLAADGAGGWVATWENPSGYDISARRRLFMGAPVSPDLTANAFAEGIQANPSVAADASGNFVVVWEDSGRDGDGYGVFGQRFDATGTPAGTEFQVNESSAGNQGAPSVSMDDAGNFVVAWVDGEIKAQRFDASGNRVGDELRVNESTNGVPFAPKVAVDGAGNFLVVWQSPNEPRLVSRRFDTFGVPLGPEVVVSTGDGSYATVAGSAAGFVTVWISASGTEAFGQRIDADGNLLGSTFRVAPAIKQFELAPAVGMDDSGGFVVAWSSGDGSQRGIFGQRFATVPPTTTAGTIGTTGRAGRAPVVILPALPTEPALTLVARESFDAEPLAGWVLPGGWTRTPVGEGFALHIAAADAGLSSTAQPQGLFGNVAVMGSFTFSDVTGTARIVARDSDAGSYVAQLDAAGLVTLEKRDSVGVVLVSWSAVAPSQALPGSARTLRLSAMGGALRVAVDGTGVLAIDDAAPLPPGSNRIGAAFNAPAGALRFDNYFVWRPSDEIVPDEGTEASAESAPLAAASLTPPPTVPTNDEAPSDNDEFAARKVVPGVRYTHVANNAAGTPNEVGEPAPSCGVNVTHTVWYEFTPPTDGPYLLTSFGSSINTVMAVYSGPNTGATFATLTPVGCSDDVTGSAQARLTLTLDDAQTYFIQLGSSNGSVGDFKLHVIDPSDALVPGTPVISTSAVGAPTTPLAQGARTNDPQPVLAWTPKLPVTPYNYLVQVSTVATFSSIVTFALVSEPTHFWEIAPALSDPVLNAGQKYYWRVTAKNYLGQSSVPSVAYSFTLDRHAPSPPLLMAPAVNGVVSSLRPTLRWGTVTEATLYGVRIAVDSACSIPIPDGDAATTITAYTPAFDVPQGEYWFCAQSRDAAGNPSGFGEKRRFVINISLSPANGATVIAQAPSYTPNVVLTWTKVPGATYNLDVATDSSFTAPVVDNLPLTGTSYTLTGQPSGIYYWRVAVSGGSLPGPLARSFTISPALPAAPLIQTTGALPGALTSAGFTNDTTPIFDWTVPANWVSPLPGASITYELQLATNSAFSPLMGALTGISASDFDWATIGPLPSSSGITYYWRVRAVTNLGLAGAFSMTYRFTLDTVAPSAPPLVSPVASGTSSSLRPTLRWSAVAGANRYGVQITTNFSCSSPIAGGVVEVATTTFTPGFDVPQGEYWFCVQSRDAAGNWSGFIGEKRRFVINVSLLPANGAKVIAKAPSYTANVVLTWTKVAGATYDLDVADDSSFTSLVVNHVPVTGTSYTLTGQPSGTYYWRVAVSGASLPGPLARSFSITPALPAAPLIQTTGALAGAVKNPGITNDASPVFDWTIPANWVSPAPGASLTYEFQLATDSAFSSPVAGSPVLGLSQSDFEWVLGDLPLTAGTTYYWRVRAITNLGLAGAFSAPYRFTLDTVDPGLPASLTAPADLAVSTSARPTFSWAAGTNGASRYRFEIAIDPAFASPVYTATVAALSHMPTESGQQGVYYWHVYALDAAGNETDTPTAYRTLTIDYRTAPAAGTVILTANPAGVPVLFTWKAPTGAPVGTTYAIEIDADLDGTPDTTLGPVTTLSVTSAALPLGAYQYRLVATNGLGTSGWRAFTISPI